MNNCCKRLFDIAVSAAALLALSPLLLWLVYAVRKNLGSPVFFVQERPGKDGKPFKMIKFRTMRDATDANGNPLPDSERLTPFGRRLRAASLDELPELWNVLKGEMSLVGPRPLLTAYLPLYNDFQARRHEVRPGITGWAQVNGRNAISWPEKFALDVWYVDHQSFWLDMKILLKTVKKVFVKEGISAEGEATMPVFTGNKRKLVIVGAGGHGKVVADTARLSGQWQGVYFVDDRADRPSEILGFPVLGDSSLLGNEILPQEFDAAVAVGDNAARAAVYQKLHSLGFALPAIIHPTAFVSPLSRIGAGTVVFAQAAVNAGAATGCGCIINTAASIDHDCRLGDFVHISPGAHLAGQTEVGNLSWFGIGSCSRQAVSVGQAVTVGAGAVVINDFSDGLTVVGNPAKPLAEKQI
ncbi:NeuD/PglB/VioB family sugar acetyltransferase [Neisseria lisongii]|nr:NeuD/PglB/VioB family sugar acetyltransferase [Neisseria lisongii]